MNNLAILAPCCAFHSCFIVFSAFLFLVLICSVLVGGVSMVGLRLSLMCGSLMVCVPSIVFSYIFFNPTIYSSNICHSLFYVFIHIPGFLYIIYYVLTFELRKKNKIDHCPCIFSALFNISKNGEVAENYVV